MPVLVFWFKEFGMAKLMASGHISQTTGSILLGTINLAIRNFSNHDTISGFFNSKFYFPNYYTIEIQKSDDQLAIQLGGCP